MRKFFRAGCAANLVANWIPALQDIKDKLESGGRAADVGCRQGASMLLMAKAYPQSQYFGFGYHDKFIAAALESAKQEGVSDSVSFEVSKAKESRAGTTIRGGVRLPLQHGLSDWSRALRQ